MGKRLIIQRRGRGTPAHRVASHRFKDKIRYISYDALEKEGSIKGIVTDIVHDPARTAPIAEVKFENGEKKTVREIAYELDTSHENVRNIRNKALMILEKLNSKGLL